MNIFHTDKDPSISAINLDDIRVNKMIIESAALLANAIAYHGGQSTDLPISKTSGQPFKTKAWQNHPSCLWVKASSSNYQWLMQHLNYLLVEISYRKGTIHSMRNNLKIIENGVKFIPPGPLTPFANCTPYKTVDDPITAYRLCMAYKWEHDGKVPVWTKRDIPEWYSKETITLAQTTECEFPWTGLRESRSKRQAGWLTNHI